MSRPGVRGEPLYRFCDTVVITETCWLWTGAPNESGYAQFRVNGRFTYVHRWSYETFVGPIPAGMQIDHLCRTPLCVRPSHLEVTTPRENTLRSTGLGAVHAAATHCPQGHPYDQANTYVRADRSRTCRACHRELETRRRNARRAA